ncbi:dihydrolipoamide acetyltransferase family protein [Herpetosiphon geysericola]|uniref:Dihydrolipoamide acetyltransferase component of pyruvate dehydrogenase complex n=1 Tax=Herpetosiphon geysericola TaxID=70996 RepID=A0A0P6XZ65_9CHLR|nr:dihydrolipoamide acetyltransferase family protein [Herpetosiphon geysericola]KPL81719.1 dehydrogenase [Herpetosiphon geysericola]
MSVEFKMPKLGESVTEGTVGRWLKQPGDSLELYEPMLEVTTDKVDTEIPAPVNGRLLEIRVNEGDTVPVGTVIAVLEDSSSATVAADAAPVTPAVAAPVSSNNGGSNSFMSPVVARLVSQHNLDIKQIAGTGKDGRVTKQDVERFVAQRDAAKPAPAPMPTPTPSSTPAPMPVIKPSSTPVPMPTITGSLLAKPVAYTPPAAAAPSIEQFAGDELQPLSGMRRAIAEHMVRSKATSPHVTTVMEVDLSTIIAHREQHKADFERQGVKLTFTPYFVQATVAGLRAVPIVNATYTDEGILLHKSVNVGMAVAIPDGLIVPVLHNADEKSLLGLSRTVNDLAERARNRRLSADEVKDGTFTITNHGVSGSLFAMPIINQPQSGILGIGAIQKRPVVVTLNGADAIAIRPMCYLSFTFDHRLIDGATADKFLATVKQQLEQFA